MSCRYYGKNGMFAASVGLIDTHGNQCGLIVEAHSPCWMEIADEAVDETRCPLVAQKEEKARMTTLERIQQEVAEITADQIAQADSALGGPEDGDIAVGQVQSEYTKRLWTLAHLYRFKREMVELAVTFQARNDQERAEMERAGSHDGALEELARDLAWIEARNELEGGWDRSTLGMREGFILIRCKAPEEDALRKLVGVGAIPLSALKKLMDEHARRMKEREQAGDAERKPQ